MLCENKLTNLVFKNQENSAKHNLLHFPSFKKKIKKKTLRMKCMNVMQCKSQEQKEKHKTKEQQSQRVEQRSTRTKKAKTDQGHRITPIT